MISVFIAPEPLSMDALREKLNLTQSREVGAEVTFSGIVREIEGDAAVTHLHYEHYEGMAEVEIEKIAQDALEQWPLEAIGVEHRVGPVSVGEASINIIVRAGHRAEAFEACRYVIDELKKRVPIWKSVPK